MRWWAVCVVGLGCAAEPPQLPDADGTTTTAAATTTTTTTGDAETRGLDTDDSTSGGTTMGSTATGPDPDSTGDDAGSSGGPSTPPSCQSGAVECDEDPGVPPRGQCNAFVQDCPDDERCVPSPTGESTSTCISGFGDLGEGQPCDTKAPGFDNCGPGLLCAALDSTGHRCYPFCGCGPDHPTCAPGSLCSLAPDRSWGVCGPPCDPLGDDCPAGSILGNLGCHTAPGSGGFVCSTATDPSADPGDPCDADAECHDGQGCVPALRAPACEGLVGNCCVELCDVRVAGACEAGRACAAWYEGTASDCDQSVGYCGFPQ